MQRHTNRITDVADARWEDLRAVQVRHSAEADGPADGVDEDGGDGRVGDVFIVCRAWAQAHVYSHVDVRAKL